MLCSATGITQADPTPLTIGDYFPRKQLLQEANLPAALWQRKSILITIWSPNCGSCFRELDHLQILQEKFQKELLILPVTESSEEEVKTLFKKVNWKLPRLNMIYNDAFFTKLFPHKIISHNIWIGKNDTVQYITDGKQVDEKQLTLFCKGINVNMPQKKELLDFDAKQALWQEGNGRFVDHLISYSYFMREIEAVSPNGGEMLLDSNHVARGFKAINAELAYLYFLETTRKRFSTLPDTKRIWLEVDKKDSVLLRQRICYESWLQNGNREKIYEVLAQDLKAHFPFTWQMEKRKVPSYALEQISDPVSSPKKNKPNGNQVYQFTKATPQGVANELEKHFNLKEPVIATIDRGTLLTIKLYQPLNTLEDLNRQLAPYGLKFTRREQELDMLVIIRK